MTNKRKQRIRALAAKLNVGNRGAANRLNGGGARQPRPATPARAPLPVEADFLADLRRIVVAQLSAAGYTVDTKARTEELLWNVLKVSHRRIERHPREVEWSSQLRARESALPESIRQALGRIVIAAETGADLNLFLSRELASDKAFKRNDMMLNELGIQHFHLGEELDSRGLVKGTDELLFAYVTDVRIHFIEVFDHKSFGDERAFRIAQQNWPHLFDDRKSGIPASRSPQSITPEQRAVLRRKHANVMVAADDGTLFVPPGGGIMTSGMSPWVLFASDRIFERLQRQEKWCKENGEVMAERYEEATGRRAERFSLRVDRLEEPGILVVVDDSLKAVFRFG
jgi:hypothetical protein